MGTQIQARALTAADFGGKEGCNDFLSVTRPEAIEAIHAAYFDAGADVVETNSFQASQTLAARAPFNQLGRRLPIQCSVTLDPTGRMLLGTDIRGALATLEAMRVEVIGLNCSTGPDLMRDAVRYLSQNASPPIHCIPNAGLPINDGGRTLYPMRPEPMAETLLDFVRSFGVNIVGGCCGTTPEHVRAVVTALGADRSPRS